MGRAEIDENLSLIAHKAGSRCTMEDTARKRLLQDSGSDCAPAVRHRSGRTDRPATTYVLGSPENHLMEPQGRFESLLTSLHPTSQGVNNDRNISKTHIAFCCVVRGPYEPTSP